MLKNNKIKNNLSNEELFQEYISSGDMVIFGELYRRYVPLVYGLCLKYLNDKDAAQDAVMDIFENISSKLSQYEIKNFNTWLYSVAKNHCLHILRKEKKTFFVKIDECVMENEDDFTLLDKPQTKEEMDALTYCIKTLPEVQQKSIHYFYIEEKSYADIVELTGYALNKVKSYIQNGKRNLKSCIIKVLNIS